MTVSIPLTFSFSSDSRPSWPLLVSRSSPLTICNFSETGHCDASWLSGLFVSAVTFENASLSGYPSRIAFVIAHPVIPLAPISCQHLFLLSSSQYSPKIKAWFPDMLIVDLYKLSRNYKWTNKHLVFTHRRTLITSLVPKAEVRGDIWGRRFLISLQRLRIERYYGDAGVMWRTGGWSWWWSDAN